MLTASNFVDPDGDSLIFTASNLPEGLTIDPETGLISGTLDGSASQEGPYDITVTATDTQGASTSLTFTMDVQNVAPIIDIGDGPNEGSFSLGEGGVLVAELTSGVGESITFDIGSLTSDPDGDQAATFSIDGELPLGLTLDPQTGVLSGSPAVPSTEPYEFTIIVDDGEGGRNAVNIILDVTQDGFIEPIEPIGPRGQGDANSVDPYEFLEGQPIDLQRYFHDRALDARDDYGRMFGDRDFRGGMVAMEVPGMEGDCAYMFVEAIAQEHNVTVAFGTTFSEFCSVNVRNWDIRMADGSAMPAWINRPNGADFMDMSRPLDTETIRLQVRALLDNGQSTSTTVEIDLGTGTVTQVSDAYTQAQTLQEQMALEAQDMREQMAEADTSQDALLKALAG